MHEIVFLQCFRNVSVGLEQTEGPRSLGVTCSDRPEIVQKIFAGRNAESK